MFPDAPEPADAPVGRGRSVHTVTDVLALLDHLFAERADRWSDRGGADFWDGFYADRDRPVPFFRWAPDESLVAWHAAGTLPLGPGARVLELGCGPGRNAVWLAQQGCQVDALDLSATAVAWGAERASAAGVEVQFTRADIFRWQPPTEPYDLVYDSGCFHHLPPHRRVSYRALLERTLRPGGRFGLACFATGDDPAEGADERSGTEADDLDLYRDGHLGGGLAYAADDLRRAFGWLTEVDLRRMRPSTDGDVPTFGEDFLWAGLFRRP
ncbi:class I SAM-dependent methyltransferase [Cellulomonas triticagri]|uniref:Class I SAM-dependent methyltransferase n=1 Tax=Cellulomonas triticagri TaxID=2483352 RepID=A0A3M2JNT0_9CELL|nr:class I SAM-dependent methyltransferase [Cellulomonas triticagri]RMI13500.1 class I SAM-dependent methyltransferase [Cellulomonas triticagri]